MTTMEFDKTKWSPWNSDQNCTQNSARGLWGVRWGQGVLGVRGSGGQGVEGVRGIGVVGVQGVGF